MNLVNQKTINIPIKTSNLKAAIKQLDGQSFRVDPKSVGKLSPNSFAVPSAVETIPGQSPCCRPPVSIGDDVQANSNGDSLDQSQQLAHHLQQKEKALIKQDADCQVRVWNWQQEVAKQQLVLDERQAELDEQESNLQSLQFDLLQLQNELIDSQLATREIVNQPVSKESRPKR